LAKKKTRAKTIKNYAYVNVLQNGVSVAESVYPLGRSQTVEISNDKNGNLVLPHYPLPNKAIPFLKLSRHRVTLIIPFKWAGFCTTKGSPVSISPLEGTAQREVTLEKGDYVSIFHDDLRIMVKIAPAEAKEFRDEKMGRLFRLPFRKFLLPTKEESQGIVIGCLAAIIIVGGFLFGLLSRPFERPSSIRDISEDYLLAFISSDLIKNAPEALKYKLNRKYFATSVLDHYQNIASVLTNRSNKAIDQHFPFTADLYKELNSASNSEINTAIRRQQMVDSEQTDRSHAAQVVIPSVVGESMAGKMVRVVDKIGIIQESLVDSLERRRTISSTFPKDQEYGFEEYKNVAKGDKNAEILAQIKPWEKTTDEQLMYQEAESLAKKAEKKQKNIRAFRDPNEQLTADNAMCIGIEEGSHLSTFMIPDSLSKLDIKIAGLSGSEYGVQAKKEIIKEPLIGAIEPHLVEKFIRQNRYQLQLCYELALRRNEEASGVMEWKWRIDSRGTISDISLVKSSIADRHLAKCLEEKISRWRFPRPRRGAVEVSYPFEFSPNKGKG